MGFVSSVAFSPDGKTLAVGHFASGTGGVTLWDVSGRERPPGTALLVPEGIVSSLAFDADGKTLAAGYTDAQGRGGGAILWDMIRRERLVDRALAVAQGGVARVAFSPDAKKLALAYQARDGASGAVIWDVGLESWQKMARSMATYEANPDNTPRASDGVPIITPRNDSGFWY
jgi:WD40 repeat protein